MRKNISKVMEAFAAGKHIDGDSKRTISTDGNTVFSYDMPIAQRCRNGSLEIIARSAGPTNTTRSHIAGASYWLESNGHMPREVATLSGHKAHVFRDRAGRGNYRDRADGNRSGLKLVR